ncbi:CoA-acylating methylmalonate-semialdehyde dehydrogenase [Celerinatantimonas sp. YJH-8]|uniref:CoA-acylating methylmalonate-semialdehyde dehydrogenase n=1 Tax=Celerinatantimonas sp. YJH-8 TaxID=3228714 RepID=UPI0038C3ED12
MKPLVSNFINGQPYPSHSARLSHIYHPATGDILGEVTLSSAAEAHEAVQYAREAQPSWAALSPSQRLQYLARFKQRLMDEQHELATLISQEQGKTESEAWQELEQGLAILDFSLELNEQLKAEYTAEITASTEHFTLYQAVGICVGITPYTFPALAPLWMFPIALSCGNCFILKPSEKTPSIALHFARMLQDAGLPAGVFQVIQGDKEVVDALLEDPNVAAVSFIGSTPIAQSVYRKGTKAGKRVQALGSTKNHMLILPDADLEQVCDDLMLAAYGEAGQRCMAIAVAVVVGQHTADQLAALLTPRVQSLIIGTHPIQAQQQMGPLVSEAQLLRVRGYIEQGEKEGARLLVDGRDVVNQTGYFLGGTLFDDVTPDMRIYKEEILGPVLAISRVDDYPQGLALINGHSLGQGAAIYTRNPDYARDFAYQVQAGMVSINSPLAIPMAYQSIGGWKSSLFGALNLHGQDGIRFYTRIKNVTSRWP